MFFLAILTINSQIILVTAPQMSRIVSIHSIYIRLTHSTHCFIFSLIQRTKTLVNTKTNNSLPHPCASLPFSWKTKPTKFLVLVLSVYFRLRNVYYSTSPFNCVQIYTGRATVCRGGMKLTSNPRKPDV